MPTAWSGDVGSAALNLPLLRPIARISRPAAAELAAISVHGTPLNTPADDLEVLTAAKMAARYSGIIRSKRMRTSKNG
jgi:hypothetical protein